MPTEHKTYAMSKSGKARFIAIGVGQGDAFFIERTDKLALVDGGRSRVGFATQFKKVTGLACMQRTSKMHVEETQRSYSRPVFK